MGVLFRLRPFSSAGDGGLTSMERPAGPVESCPGQVEGQKSGQAVSRGSSFEQAGSGYIAHALHEAEETISHATAVSSQV